MILHQGNCVLIVHRRLFEEDHPRFFIGSVDFYEDGIAKITGYSWARDPYSGNFEMKEDRRTKIVSLVMGSVFAYELPDAQNVKEFKLETSARGRLVLVGPQGFKMDLTESPKKP